MNHSSALFADRDRLFLKLPLFVKQLEFLMREAIRACHAACGITQAAFVKGMLKLGGTGAPDLVLLPAGITLDASGDPYSQLDLRTCLKYLCCGGLRILSEEDGVREYAADQDAFFRFFDIEYRYEEASQRPCGRVLKAGDFSRDMLRLHRILTVEDKESPFSLLSPKGLRRKVKALMSLVQPLCDTAWEHQAACEELMRQLVQAHFTATDAEAEERCMQREADAEAMYQKGCRLQHGDGVPRDPEAAVRCYQKAAEQGHQAAQLALGGCYRMGTGVTHDEHKALGIYRKLHDEGYGPGTIALAECYLQGFGVDVDLEKVRNLLLHAGEAGFAEAWNRLGQYCLEDRRFVRDEAYAFSVFALAAHAGNAEGAYNLGECYRTGIGTDPDPALAVHWFQQAADGGSALGMFALGSCYLNGNGTREDARMAHHWYCSAADTGMAMAGAMADAATVLLPEPDHTCSAALAASLSWLILLARSGESAAAYLLARFYEDGICVETDAALAFSWYDAAAKGESKPALRAVAWCLYHGFGVEADPVQALLLYSKAVEGGDPLAINALAELLTQGVVPNSLIAALRQRGCSGNTSAC